MRDITEELARGTLATLILHMIAISLVEWLLCYRINIEALLILLAGWPKLDLHQERAVLHSVAGHTFPVLSYIVSTSMAGLIFGFIAHYVARRLCLDIRFPLFRFSNDWHYLFTGEAIAFDTTGTSGEIRHLRDSIDFVYITALVDRGGIMMLYWGIITGFHFNRQGELDRIVLQSAHRRRLETDPVSGDESDIPESFVDDLRGFYAIRGNFLIIPYANVKNINVEYIKVESRPLEQSDWEGLDCAESVSY